MIPVPTTFRTPSASVMTREITMPVFVESKYDTGSRSTCACTRLRMSVMARWPATLTTCDSENDVTAWISVAPATASASGMSRSGRCLPITVSIRYFELPGNTNPASRLTTMSDSPMTSDCRCSAISSRASRQARFGSSGFLTVAPPAATEAPRRLPRSAERAPGSRGMLTPQDSSREGPRARPVAAGARPWWPPYPGLA